MPLAAARRDFDVTSWPQHAPCLASLHHRVIENIAEAYLCFMYRHQRRHRSPNNVDAASAVKILVESNASIFSRCRRRRGAGDFADFERSRRRRRKARIHAEASAVEHISRK